MEVIHALIEERNAFETEPFVAIIESNVALNASLEDLKRRHDLLQIESTRQKEDIDKVHTYMHA